MDVQPALATPSVRRARYRENIPFIFGATADLYYAYWGEFFHLAIFGPDESWQDYPTALERTHVRYFDAIRGRDSHRILELATGGGAFAAWMAERTSGEVVGIDLSETQLSRAWSRVENGIPPNLRFTRQDIMLLHAWNEAPFDAAVCLDAACYLPDRDAGLRAIATRLERGARFLLVDWCRSDGATGLQEELILEPFYRAWGIAGMESVGGYERGFDRAGFNLVEIDDLSASVKPNWERAYRLALLALAEVPAPHLLVRMAARILPGGPRALRLAKDQFAAALLIKAAADSGLIRYVSFVAERRSHSAH